MDECKNIWWARSLVSKNFGHRASKSSHVKISPNSGRIKFVLRDLSETVWWDFFTNRSHWMLFKFRSFQVRQFCTNFLCNILKLNYYSYINLKLLKNIVKIDVTIKNASSCSSSLQLLNFLTFEKLKHFDKLRGFKYP